MLRFASMTFLLMICSLLLAPGVEAQLKVSGLQDLIGTRGRDGEAELKSRGFEYKRGDKDESAAYTYWVEPRTNRCISVRTADGRYDEIMYTAPADCKVEDTATQLPATPPDGPNSFDTVCGVETGGETYRYRCQLRNEGCEGQGYCRTIVEMPDNQFAMEAVKGSKDQIQVTFEGMNPLTATSAFSDGQTRFELEGKTYFVYRSPDRAKRELAKLP